MCFRDAFPEQKINITTSELKGEGEPKTINHRYTVSAFFERLK